MQKYFEKQKKKIKQINITNYNRKWWKKRIKLFNEICFYFLIKLKSERNLSFFFCSTKLRIANDKLIAIYWNNYTFNIVFEFYHLVSCVSFFFCSYGVSNLFREKLFQWRKLLNYPWSNLTKKNYGDYVITKILKLHMYTGNWNQNWETENRTRRRRWRWSAYTFQGNENVLPTLKFKFEFKFKRKRKIDHFSLFFGSAFSSVFCAKKECQMRNFVN